MAQGSEFLAHIMLVNTLGLSVIVESFREAKYYLLHASSTTKWVRDKAKEMKPAFLFIQGTGLEMTLQRYGCDYDADQLRTSFYSLVKRRDLID